MRAAGRTFALALAACAAHAQAPDIDLNHDVIEIGGTVLHRHHGHVDRDGALIWSGAIHGRQFEDSVFVQSPGEHPVGHYVDESGRRHEVEFDAAGVLVDQRLLFSTASASTVHDGLPDPGGKNRRVSKPRFRENEWGIEGDRAVEWDYIDHDRVHRHFSSSSSTAHSLMPSEILEGECKKNAVAYDDPSRASEPVDVTFLVTDSARDYLAGGKNVSNKTKKAAAKIKSWIGTANAILRNSKVETFTFAVKGIEFDELEGIKDSAADPDTFDSDANRLMRKYVNTIQAYRAKHDSDFVAVIGFFGPTTYCGAASRIYNTFTTVAEMSNSPSVYVDVGCEKAWAPRSRAEWILLHELGHMMGLHHNRDWYKEKAPHWATSGETPDERYEKDIKEAKRPGAFGYISWPRRKTPRDQPLDIRKIHKDAPGARCPKRTSRYCFVDWRNLPTSRDNAAVTIMSYDPDSTYTDGFVEVPFFSNPDVTLTQIEGLSYRLVTRSSAWFSPIWRLGAKGFADSASVLREFGPRFRDMSRCQYRFSLPPTNARITDLVDHGKCPVLALGEKVPPELENCGKMTLTFHWQDNSTDELGFEFSAHAYKYHDYDGYPVVGGPRCEKSLCIQHSIAIPGVYDPSWRNTTGKREYTVTIPNPRTPFYAYVRAINNSGPTDSNEMISRDPWHDAHDISPTVGLPVVKPLLPEASIWATPNPNPTNSTFGEFKVDLAADRIVLKVSDGDGQKTTVNVKRVPYLDKKAGNHDSEVFGLYGAELADSDVRRPSKTKAEKPSMWEVAFAFLPVGADLANHLPSKDWAFDSPGVSNGVQWLDGVEQEVWIPEETPILVHAQRIVSLADPNVPGDQDKSGDWDAQVLLDASDLFVPARPGVDRKFTLTAENAFGRTTSETRTIPGVR